MRHREAFAVEAQAPTREEWAQSERDEDDDPGPARRVVAATPAPAGATTLTDDDLPQDVLVVVSKLKKYIKARSGMNTSDGVVDVLSDRLRRMCDGAIRNAGRDGRKTVMARDFESLD
jgi:histone H3/H4